MTMAEAPFWVWIPLVLTSSLFFLMCLTPFLWEWYQEDQARTQPIPIPVMEKTRSGIVLNSLERARVPKTFNDL